MEEKDFIELSEEFGLEEINVFDGIDKDIETLSFMDSDSVININNLSVEAIF